MSTDKKLEEIEESPESSTIEPGNPESVIANPNEQRQWSKSQEVHYLPKDESATHIALSPGHLADLKSRGLAQKFEIVDGSAERAKPSDNIIKEGEVPEEFIEQIKIGLREIPENERLFLEKAGVKVVAKDEVKGHGGSPAIFEPDKKRVVIGVKASLQSEDSTAEQNSVTWRITPRNSDIKGSLKHEIGHALYHTLNLDNWEEFKKIVSEEKEALSKEDRDHLTHLLEDDSELFAESYAFIRGRQSSRIDILVLRFPRTIDLISKKLATQMEDSQP